MQLIGIADSASDLVYCIMRHSQQFGGFDHAVADQELLRRLSDRVLEYFAEVAAVEAGTLRNVFYGDVALPEFGLYSLTDLVSASKNM